MNLYTNIVVLKEEWRPNISVSCYW